WILLMAGFASRLEEHRDRPAHRAAVGDMLWAADRVVLVAAAFVVFGTDEVRKDVVVGPAGCTRSGPLIVVVGVAADVDHCVHRARSSEHPAAWQIHSPPAQRGLALA